MKTILKLALLILLPAVAQAQSGWNLVFSDEFNGNSLNSSVWGTTYPGGGQCTQQNEDEVYLPGALSVGSGNLTIFTLNNGSYADDGGGFICPGPWQSGLIQSNASNTTFTYGYFDAREKIPSGAGFWPAFWLYAATGTSGPEIDIMEMLNTATTTVYQTYHPTPSSQSQNVATSGTDCSANYCDFAVDWEPGVLRFYLNGTLTYTYSNADVSSVAMYVLTNLAVGGTGSFPGSWNGTTPSPASMLVDYIRVYQHPSSGAGCYSVIPGPTPIPTTSCAPLPPPSTVHYSDYVTGNDSNAGTSTAAPWKHAPGMLGLTPAGAATGDACSLNCASYTPQPGDLIILKGGSVWPYTTAPFSFAASGTSSAQLYGCAGSGCIYIGNAVGAGLPAWNSGKVTSITLKRDLGGWNPASPPTISCSSGGGSGAAATPLVVPAAETNDPWIAEFIYHINLTNPGSGYTSVPTCALSGGGTATLAADIDRPVFDLGSTQGSPPVWPLGECGTFSTTCAPFVITGHDVLASGIEVRNMLTTQSTAGGLDSEERPFVDLQGTNDTANNFYVHGMGLNCVVTNTSCANFGGNNAAIELEQPYDEAANDIVENGDVVFLGTSGQDSAGICTTNYLCGTFAFGYETGTQGGLGPVSVHNSLGYSNLWQLRLAGSDATGSDPYLSYGLELWMTTYSANQGAHENSRYSQLAAGQTLFSYNNIVHSQVQGTSSQIQCALGTTFNFYNEVQWGIGTGTQPYSLDMVDAGGTGGCAMNLYNDTMYANQSGTVCVNSQNGSDVTTITLQNLHCITTPSAQNPFWLSGVSNSTYQDYAGSTTSANIQAASTVQSITTANGQGYATTNLFSPTVNTNSTVTFASGGGSANLTSLCSGYLTALCSDINGNARTNAGFQSGAYNFGGAMPSCTSPSISPASGSYVSPQTVTMLTSVGCAIFYTTDNTTPTCSSTAYTAGFSQSIVTTTYIQAIACQTGYTTSGVTINSYTLNATPPPVTPNPLLFVCAGTHATCCPAVAVVTTQYCLSVDGLFLSSQGSQYAQMLIPGPAGAPGAPGPAGAQGVTGKTGATGPAGASGVLSVNSIKPAANGNVTITPTLSVTPK